MPRLSLAARLAAVGGVIAAVAICLTAWSIVWQVERAMTDRIQSRLEVNLRVARDQMRRHGGVGPVRVENDRLIAPNGRVLDGDVELVDRIRDIAEGTATVFKGDLRVSTNVLLPDGRRAIGTHLAPGLVYDAVLGRGQTYRGEADILGTTYLTAYDPLKDAAGNVVGILYVGVQKASYFAIITDIRVAALLCGLMMILFGAGAIFLVVRRAFQPLDTLRDTMGALAAGQLDAVVPALERGDEIGRMAQAVQVFKQTAVEFAKAKAAQLSDAHRLAQIGTWRRDLILGTLSISNEAHALIGTDPHSFDPTIENLLGMVHPDDRCGTAMALDVARTASGAITHETRILRRNGGFACIRFEAHPELDDTGRPIAVRGICQDVTGQHAAADRIHWLAHHDPLTGLANRTLLHERISHTLARARRAETTVAVLCLDLDGFKSINDLNGHAGGDAVLREVAARLQCNVRESDTVARLGGDEFVVVHDVSAEPDAFTALAGRLVEILAEPYDLDDGQIGHVTVSIGVAMFPSDGLSAETLLRNADTALYRAKAAGKNGTAFFQPDMDVELRERRALEYDLRQALDRGEFHLAWQPLCKANAELAPTGFEVLLRWRHPARGLVRPDVFIPVAETCGEISAIGGWVLRQACQEAANWAVPLQVSVNVSPIQAQQGSAFVDSAEQALAASGLHPSRLMLEVTEGVLIREPERVLAALRRLKLLGVSVALDDFGTGYSSLATLRSFPFDKIKIDRSFITGVADNGQDAAIVRAVLGLASGLGLPVIAEGVETHKQLDALRDAGCQEVQGWLAGRPASIASFAHLIGAEMPASAA